MAWTDKPSEAQLRAWAHKVRWDLPTDLIQAAYKYLENNTTRREMSNEMDRIWGLKDKHGLDKETCFASPIWNKFKSKE